MKHYVVMCDYALTDGDTYHGVGVTGVTHSLEKAKEMLAKASIGEKEYANEHDWEILVNTDVEFCACKDIGCYEAEHAHFYIEEVA